MKIIIRDNIKYQLDTYKKTAIVIGYKDKPVDVIIPEYIEYKHEKYKVTEIGKHAFNWCDSLTSITIHDSITKICPFAFFKCKILTSVTIHGSVTFIGHGAFQNCKELKSVFIPNSVTFIGDGVFFNCENLTSITIPYTVTHIGDCAFQHCKRLKSVNILNNVTEIGCNTFDNIGLTLPKRYTEDGKLIAYKAFYTDMTCRKFQYEEGKTFEIKGEKIKCCHRGFHACTNPLDVFNYYYGEIGKDIVIHEVYLSGDIDEHNDDSKVCASKIEIGRRLSLKDINEIINTTY